MFYIQRNYSYNSFVLEGDALETTTMVSLSGQLMYRSPFLFLSCLDCFGFTHTHVLNFNMNKLLALLYFSRQHEFLLN